MGDRFSSRSSTGVEAVLGDRRLGDRRLEDVVRRLVREFDHEHAEAAVVRCVQRCHDRLAAAGVEADLAERTEVLARAVLLHPASTRPRLRAAPEPGAPCRPQGDRPPTRAP